MISDERLEEIAFGDDWFSPEIKEMAKEILQMRKAKDSLAEKVSIKVNLPPLSFFDFRKSSGYLDGAYVNIAAMNRVLESRGIFLEPE